MTLGVTTSAPADRDHTFSQALRKNARSLELTDLMPVGVWHFGQGIRRAQDHCFFWDLSSDHFQPLGLNHPTALSGIESSTSYADSLFTQDLMTFFPELAGWKWNLISPEHAWMKKPWQRSSAWNKASGPWLLEDDPTFKSENGWQGFGEISQLEGWAVRLSTDVYWVASRSPIEYGIAAPLERAQMRILLSADLQIRLREVQALLREKLSSSECSGLNLKFTGSAEKLACQGLKSDRLADKVVGLCFPMSFLEEDLTGIARLFSLKG